MQQWISLHFYPVETQEVFLTRALRPFLEQFVWPQAGARAFFIRFDDEKGPHIRLRIRGEAEWLDEKIRPVLEGWFEGRGAWTEQTYEPETERFGGQEGMQAAEEYFHLSTRVVLALMNKPYTYNDALFDALRLHTVTAFAAGWNREKAAWYFEKLAKLWLPLFFRDADTGAAPDAAEQAEILRQLEENVMSQQTALKSSLQDLWAVLETDKFDKTQPDWVRWVRGNQMIIKELGANLEKAMPSLLHLNYNRLGIYNQDEVYLNLLLARLL